MGEITFAVPQVREGGFYPQALEKGLRSERALTLALAEMYVQGVSTRKVKAITEQLCGVSITSSAVSQAARQLDVELEKWRERPLGEYPFLFLDAYYEQVREDGQVRHLAVLVAVGVTPAGKREILGVSVSLSEHEVHWRAFLESLKQRGLGGVQLITSDDHAGLRAARLAVFGGHSLAAVPVPPAAKCTGLCATQGHASRSRSRHPHDLRCARPHHRRSLSGQSREQIQQTVLRACPSGWQPTSRKVSPVFAFPAAFRKLLRTTNGVERLHREVRRRARVVSIFPNSASCLRLVSAVLAEISEEWLTGRTYMIFEGTT